MIEPNTKEKDNMSSIRTLINFVNDIEIEHNRLKYQNELKQTELDKFEEMHDWLIEYSPSIKYAGRHSPFSEKSVTMEKDGHEATGYNIWAAYFNLKEKLEGVEE